MKILPTPQFCTQSAEAAPLRGFSEVILPQKQDETVRWALAQLEEACPLALAGAERLTLRLSDDPFFKEKNAAEQGYILTRGETGVILEAQSSVGFLYGIMTLRQLIPDAPARLVIRDRPQIRFRGNMNTLWAESGVWSYDFGDGPEAACARLRRAIDEAARA